MKFHRKTPVLESLFNKVAVSRPATLRIRELKTGVFLWNLLNFKNTYSEKHLRATAPDYSRRVI